MRQSKAKTITGWALTGLFTLFMLMDIGMKLLDLPQVDQTMAQMGWPGGLGRMIGVLEAIFLALYLFPRTAMLGAVLMTGVFGGAIGAHWRIADPLFSHTLFGVYLGLAMWGGLVLRDATVRGVFPVRI